MSVFEVHVVPRAKRAGPYGRHGGRARLRVSAPASDGRANAETERLLTDLLRSRVRLIGGKHSRLKRFEVDLDRTSLDERLRTIFG